MRNLWILSGLFLLFCCMGLNAQERTFSDGYDDYGCYGYQPCWRWTTVRQANYGGREKMDSLLEKLQQADMEQVICPWWIEDLYGELPESVLASFRRISYVGYVLNPCTGAQYLANEWNNSHGVLDDSLFARIPFELMVYCRSGKELDIFLESEQAQLRFLRRVFTPGRGAINRLHCGQKPVGIHFYFPEVTFLKKKELLRFIKSVSMVIDAFETDGQRPYEGDQCLFYVTFSPEARSEIEFISGLLDFTDAVYFAGYDDYGVPVGKVTRIDHSSDPASLVARMRNQFYLLHLGAVRSDVLQTGSGDFEELMHADYATNNWQIYFYIAWGLVVLLLVLLVLYNTSSSFYMLVTGFRKFVVPVVITLLIEILIVWLFMLEAFSRYTLFINMDDNSHYFLLALPLVFIVINIFFRAFNRNEIVP